MQIYKKAYGKCLLGGYDSTENNLILWVNFLSNSFYSPSRLSLTRGKFPIKLRKLTLGVVIYSYEALARSELENNQATVLMLRLNHIRSVKKSKYIAALIEQ